MKAIITVLGMVQGIGFRPFVARLAESMQLCGTVRNSGGVVIIECDAETGVLEEFVRRLRFLAPRGAQILDIKVSERYGEVRDEKEASFSKKTGFRIIKSDSGTEDIIPIVPPDIGICPDCRRELLSHSDRRSGYPYISCTICGPRYSIMEQLPYDRGHITMRSFRMCTACGEEYRNKESRRRHAQTISCYDCGPQLLLTEAGKKESDILSIDKDTAADTEQKLQRCTTILKAGGVLAVKGVGGYQLCCSAGCPEAVKRIRRFKQREKKPFAVMFADTDQIREYCEVSETEQELLESAAAPIVLLKRKKSFDPAVCGDSSETGAFLPYTGIHELLLRACGPLVMTSANITSEPIIISDDRMRELVFGAGDKGERNGCVDAIAWNTREILRPLDDSLCRVVEGKAVFLRRSRGYVPLPLLLGSDGTEITGAADDAALCCGGDLKAVFALSAVGRAYLSQYFGDIEHYAVEEIYEREIYEMQKMFGISPKQIVCDRHPGYISHQFAEHAANKGNLPLLQIQHHHAHIASVMAEHSLSHCIGVAMDGTGYGPDGAVWGCEFMHCRDAGFCRMGHLEYCGLLGADSSARDAAQTAAVQLLQLPKQDKACEKMIRRLLMCGQHRESYDIKKVDTVKAALKNHINVVESSSMGRLFDTVSALTGIREYNGYEGECAAALENAAEKWQVSDMTPVFTFPIKEHNENGKDMLIVGRFALLDQIIKKLNEGCDREAAAYAFHEAVSQMILEMCRRIREITGEEEVSLSGGVFANMLLLSRTARLLRTDGFSVNWNQSVPANDGGVAYGQAWIAQQYEKRGRKLPDGYDL